MRNVLVKNWLSAFAMHGYILVLGSHCSKCLQRNLSKLLAPCPFPECRLRRAGKLHLGPHVASQGNISCRLSPHVQERIPAVSPRFCLISLLHAAAECWAG